MEGQEKSKKVAKEKRSVKKSKTVALPAKEIPAAPVAAKPSVRKTAGAGNRETSRSLQQSKGTELRASSAPCLLYWRATQKLGNAG